MQQPQAFIFDLNGTMIDDMQYHIKAWYHILNDDLGAHLGWQEVKSHMYGKNQELLLRVFGPGRFSEKEMDEISHEKEKRYQQEFFPDLKLMDGLADFLEALRKKNSLMAIGSAAIPFNIDFVLDNLSLRHYFHSIVSADDVSHSKPDPETYLLAAEKLQVPAASCIVFEDAPKGVEAAMHAGMSCVVLTTMHEQEEFSQYPNVLACMSDYTHPFCSELLTSSFSLPVN